jgi:pyridoxal phosphate enzyme (YggS family)
MIQDNIARIRAKIEDVCRKVGRDPQDITLIGVTKFADISLIEEALAAGVTHLGENKVQDARKKFSLLRDPHRKVTKHMIGHLQTNKVKHALEVFDLIQSVDSLKLATAIEEQAAKMNKVADVLIQVNTSGEEQKFGIAPSDFFILLDDIIPLQHLRVRGLMTMAPFEADRDIIRKCFLDLRLLRDQVKGRFGERIDMKYLSMGMTADYDIALEEGANMIRIGSAIFAK